jgi:hypothetical protein
VLRILGAAPVALALVLAGSTAAVADPATEYTMHLSSTSATVAAGHLAATVILFDAEPYLDNTRVTLSVTGLPSGVTAWFIPVRPRIDGRAPLTLITSPTTPAQWAAVTITAITISSDPIGTSVAFGLTVRGDVPS